MTLLLVFTLTIACSGGSNQFEQFEIEDVTNEHQFMDNKSAAAGRVYLMNHENMRYSIEGELDSSALVQFISYPKNNTFKEIALTKGSVSMVNYLTDYYEGDTILIRFIPKGCRKGRLKISTNVN